MSSFIKSEFEEPVITQDDGPNSDTVENHPAFAEKAKMEVAAYTQMTLQRAGIEHLQAIKEVKEIYGTETP